MTIDLSDTTFMIPVKIESEDRINNLNIVTMYLREHFNTKIIIAEQGNAAIVPNILCKTLFDAYILYKSDSHLFHKTRLINSIAKFTNTPLVAMCDSDILMEPDQYISAINKLRTNTVDFIYPFNGKCINIQKQYIPQVMETLQFNFVSHKFTNAKSIAYGGCVMYNRDKFIEGGMMNEYFMSYGPEDGEQDVRFNKLRYRTERINKPLWHLDHVRTSNSMETHDHARQNWNEFNKIKNYSYLELKKYIAKWPWLKT